MMRARKILPVIFFTTLLYFYCAKSLYAANVAGIWIIENGYPDEITAQVEEVEKCPGEWDKHTSYQEKVWVPQYIPIEISQSQDGFISGGWTKYGTTTKIRGTVSGNSVSFKCTRVTNLNPMFDSIITITEYYSGIISGNNITATLHGTYHQEANLCAYCTYQSVYDATFTGDSNIGIISQQQVLDTFITSGPDGVTTDRSPTFSWIGFGGDGSIAGYYYQLDAQPKVYTTGTSVTFNNLDYGPHTFSVAAKDTADNIDSTPAIADFTLSQIFQPNPGPDAYYGNPKDQQAAVGDPINLVTGNMHIIAPDFLIPGRGLNFEFTRAYNSRANDNGPLGYGWTHSYNITLAQDEGYLLVKIKDGQARGYLFAENGDGTYTSQRGEYSTLSKEAGSFTWRKKDGKKYIFDLSGKLTQIKDRNDNTVTLSYDAGGRLIKITDTVNRQINLDYDGQNRIIAITGPLSRSFNYTYDLNGNLTRVTGPEGNYTSYEYDPEHNLTKKIDAQGNPVYFTYDASDRCFSSSGENNDGRITLAFDPASRQTTLTSSKGNQTAYSYNYDLLITEAINAQGAKVGSAWNRQLNLISRTDENGNTTSMAYDANGNLIRFTDAEAKSTSFTYEPNFNLLASSTDANGGQAAYTYDDRGNLIKVVDAGGNAATYTYNSFGQQISATNGLGKTTYFTYDDEGNLSSLKDALDNTTYFSYDGAGNLIQSQIALDILVKFSYDSLNQLTKVVYPDNSSLSYDYDEVGNRAAITDANSNVTHYTYDQGQRIKSVVDPLGNTISYDYDSEGNLTALTDQNGNRTSYEYDNLNRRIAEVNTLNQRTEYRYDAAGNRIGLTNAKGEAINYEYDSLNRLTKTTYPDGSAVVYSYDSLGRRASMVDQKGATNYTYDALSRLTKVDGPLEDDTIEYTYDAAGSRLSMTDPDGKTTAYGYDGLNRLVSVSDPQGKTTNYSYDALGNLAELIYPNGVKASYTYDSLSRLVKLTQQKTSAPFEKLAEFNYGYDSAGRRVEAGLLDGDKISYTYDASGRLTSEAMTGSNNPYQLSFEYDPAGNRIRMLKGAEERIYAYNDLNQLIEEDIRGSGKITVTGSASDNSGIKSVTVNGATASLDGENFSCEITLTEGANTITVTAMDNAGNSAAKSVSVAYEPGQKIVYVYDEKGNLIKKQTTDQAINLTYDAGNRLTQFSGPGQNITYAYDGDGKRITASEGALTTNYLYDGLNVVLERDGPGSTLVTYIRNHTLNGGIGGVIKASVPLDAVPERYYHYDALGSVVGLTDPAGQSLQSYNYDAFGNLLRQDSSVINPYQFSTKSADPTGFIYFGARYYDPRIGRFITADPIGASDGPNLYLYCRNNPVNWLDPWGLCVEGVNKKYWPKWSEIFIPGYEDYGGPIRTDLTFQRPPKDTMDRLYMKHDINWLTGRIISADKTIYADLYNLSDSPVDWPEPPAHPIRATIYRRVVAEPYFWWRSFFLQKDDD